eukprot:TRINITY_DN64715_c0_g1_i4.p2 TRINITY_DN64715_c0_g1~~TRINITY_DN64715_c0_g1_i4.p2  ORF type:complete len:106 (+),score=5.69 TRINITY_DN64715_c0_g1_i4:455-772(+)
MDSFIFWVRQCGIIHFISRCRPMHHASANCHKQTRRVFCNPDTHFTCEDIQMMSGKLAEANNCNQEKLIRQMDGCDLQEQVRCVALWLGSCTVSLTKNTGDQAWW